MHAGVIGYIALYFFQKLDIGIPLSLTNNSAKPVPKSEKLFIIMNGGFLLLIFVRYLLKG